MVEVTRKTNVDRTLDIMSKLFPEEYHFHPRSWFLPQQFAEFADDARKLNEAKRKKPVFIVKPDEGSQGDGIYLITDPKDFLFNGRYHVVQEYLSEPLLLEDLKFDLRIYVVLKSLEPLEIYIYNEGLARFCTEPYEPPTIKNMHKSYMHLTNYSLNKHSNTYEHTENEDDGSKRSLRSVFKRLRHKGYDVDKIWEDIRKLVVKTLIALAPDLKVEFRSTFPLNKPTGPKPFHVSSSLHITPNFCSCFHHYSDVIMSATASQITNISTVCSAVCSGAHQNKHQSFALLALCEGNLPVTGRFPSQRASNAEKSFHLMTSSCIKPDRHDPWIKIFPTGDRLSVTQWVWIQDIKVI